MKDPIPGIVAKADRPIAELVAYIKAEHAACEQSVKAGLVHALNVGQVLNQIKPRLGHGKWGDWLKANIPFSERTARYYMHLDRDRDKLGNSATVAVLGYREAIELLADKRKDEPVEETEFLSERAGGQKPSPSALPIPGYCQLVRWVGRSLRSMRPHLEDRFAAFAMDVYRLDDSFAHRFIAAADAEPEIALDVVLDLHLSDGLRGYFVWLWLSHVYQVVNTTS